MIIIEPKIGLCAERNGQKFLIVEILDGEVILENIITKDLETLQWPCAKATS